MTANLEGASFFKPIKIMNKTSSRMDKLIAYDPVYAVHAVGYLAQVGNNGKFNSRNAR